jgi:uncharacterized membrane protein
MVFSFKVEKEKILLESVKFVRTNYLSPRIQEKKAAKILTNFLAFIFLDAHVKEK